MNYTTALLNTVTTFNYSGTANITLDNLICLQLTDTIVDLKMNANEIRCTALYDWSVR